MPRRGSFLIFLIFSPALAWAAPTEKAAAPAPASTPGDAPTAADAPTEATEPVAPVAPASPSETGAESPAQSREAATPEAPPAVPVTPAPPSKNETPAPAPSFGTPPNAPDAPSASTTLQGPARGRFHVSLNSDHAWNSDPGFDLFSKDDVESRWGIGVGYSIWVEEPWSITPEIGWGTSGESAEGLFAGALAETDLRTNVLYGGVTAMYDLLGFLAPYARLALGVSFTDIRLTTGDGTEFEDRGGSPFYSLVAPFGTAGAGIALRTPDGALRTHKGNFRTLSFALMLEGGYQWMPPLDVTLDATDDQGRVPITDANLGELDRSGAYLRLALGGQF